MSVARHGVTWVAAMGGGALVAVAAYFSLQPERVPPSLFPSGGLPAPLYLANERAVPRSVSDADLRLPRAGFALARSSRARLARPRARSLGLTSRRHC